MELTLDNDIRMPALGSGVFQTTPDETVAAVHAALETGYRLIDTAAAYGNEREVGEGIRRSGLARDQVFIQAKVWISDYGYDQTLHAFGKSAAKLGVEQINLLLLHQRCRPDSTSPAVRTTPSGPSSPRDGCGRSGSATSCPTISPPSWTRPASCPR